MSANKSIEKALSLLENEASKALGLKIGTRVNIQPGEFIPKADAQLPPELSFSGPLTTEKKYMVIALDIDAPFPSFGVLGPILHWIQPGFQALPDENTPGTFTLKSTAPFVADYIGPAPPPGSSPHRYIFFLYEEPSEFDVEKYAPPNGKSLSNWYRMRYDLDAWERGIGLGRVLGVNYFTSH